MCAVSVMEDPKLCETFSCLNHGVQNVQIAPGTSVWLCKVCAYRETKALGRPWIAEDVPRIQEA